MKLDKILILLFCGLLFGATSLYLPNYSSSVTKKTAKLHMLMLQMQKSTGIQTEIQSQKQQINILDSSFPNKKELVYVAEFIDDLGNRTATVSKIHFESEEITKDSSGSYSIPITITDEGSYKNVVSFISNIKNGKYFFSLQKIESNSPDGMSQKNKVVLSGFVYAKNK